MLMLTGKAVQRALRGYLLVDKCPNYMMMTDLAAKNPMFASLLVEAETMYSSLLPGMNLVDIVVNSK